MSFSQYGNIYIGGYYKSNSTGLRAIGIILNEIMDELGKSVRAKTMTREFKIPRNDLLNY